jgi:hypothetical protein
MSEKSASSLWVMGDLLSFHHFRPLVYFFRHARSPVVTYPGHAWLPVLPRKELRPQSSVLRLMGIITPQPLMTQHDAEPADMGISEEDAIHLALPELLPANHTLVVNPAKRIVILFYEEPGDGVRSVREQVFTPSAMRILIPLLQAYPNYCTYEILLTHLYPMPVEEVRKQLQAARETTMRPLRRAISTMKADLHPFGLQVTSLRNMAYILQRLM